MGGSKGVVAFIRSAAKRAVVSLATHGLVSPCLADRLIQGLGLVHD